MTNDDERALATLRTLEEVVGWMAAREPRGRIVGIVTQDEYTHDVVVDLGHGRFAVFDTT